MEPSYEYLLKRIDELQAKAEKQDRKISELWYFTGGVAIGLGAVILGLLQQANVFDRIFG